MNGSQTLNNRLRSTAWANIVTASLATGLDLANYITNCTNFPDFSCIQKYSELASSINSILHKLLWLRMYTKVLKWPRYFKMWWWWGVWCTWWSWLHYYGDHSMQTLFMIGFGQVVGYLDLDLEPLYDHDYLEFSCHRSKSERLKTSLAIISFHFIFNITTVWRVTCGVCWEKKLHSPQISGPQTAIWQLLRSVHQIWKRVKRLLFRFRRCGGKWN